MDKLIYAIRDAATNARHRRQSWFVDRRQDGRWAIAESMPARSERDAGFYRVTPDGRIEARTGLHRTTIGRFHGSEVRLENPCTKP